MRAGASTSPMRATRATSRSSRQGVYLAYIPTPDPPTNVKFGRGADQQTSFITARKSLYRIRVERSGYHLGF